jgi:hypothetical protein
LRVRAAAREIGYVTVNLVADSEFVDTVVHRVDNTRQVAAEDHRSRAAAFRATAANLVIDGIEGDGSRADADVSGPDFGQRELRRREIVGAAERRQHDRLHVRGRRPAIVPCRHCHLRARGAGAVTTVATFSRCSWVGDARTSQSVRADFAAPRNDG